MVNSQSTDVERISWDMWHGKGSLMKKKITLERHREIGLLLKGLNKTLCSLSMEFTSAAGRPRKVLNGIAEMQKHLTRVRSEAEEVMARDHMNDWDVNVYYGPRPGHQGQGIRGPVQAEARRQGPRVWGGTPASILDPPLFYQQRGSRHEIFHGELTGGAFV